MYIDDISGLDIGDYDSNALLLNIVDLYSGVELGPGEEIMGILEILVKDGAMQNHNYYFYIYVDFGDTL